MGLQKVILLGARVEGKTMDVERLKSIGGFAKRGGLEGLRGEIVAVLQGVGMGLVGGLEGVGMGVYGTLEGRRRSLEEESGGSSREQEADKK